MENNDKLLDLDQLADLLGEPASPSQRAMLADMWRDMIAEVNRELEAINDQFTDTDVKRSMHRMRGVVSMWGLCLLARRMQEIEKASSPLVEWQGRRIELAGILHESQRTISARHPWLGRVVDC